MSLLRDITPYLDGNDLVAPSIVPLGTKRASDNGVTHSSRYLILQHLNNEVIDKHCLAGVLDCIGADDYLHRAPDDPSQNAPDDHYSIFSLLTTLDITYYPITLPWACCHPMLIYMRALSRGGWRSFLARALSLPMAIVIALSNLGEPAADTSNKLLTWNIIQGTKKSLLCRIGAMIWNARIDSADAARIYYGTHPLVNYWKK